MSRLIIFVFIALASGIIAAPATQFVSANERYSVELSRTPEHQILVAIFEISKDAKVFQWSRNIDWEDPHPFFIPTVQNIKALITNDGNTVILREDAVPEPKNRLMVLKRSKPEPRILEPFLPKLTAMRPPESFPPEERYTRGMRAGTSYSQAGSYLDVILDEEKQYAAWFGQTDQWLLIGLEDYKLRIANDANEIERLNRLMRRKALELVSQHQPDMLRRAINALRGKVAKIAPSLGVPSQRRHMSVETGAAYLFLTTRGESADRRYIEGLVSCAPEGFQRGVLFPTEPMKVELAVAQPERLVGDFLLSRWNGQTNREFLPREMCIFIPSDSYQYLGTAVVDLRLPIALPAKPGNFWLYLIPASVPTNQWSQSDKVVRFISYLEREGLQKKKVLEMPVYIRGITPGDYRIKTVWERHPKGGMWQTNIHTALAGDYESLESSMIRVKAGEISAPLVLFCTNRLGGAEAYASDEPKTK